MTMIYCYSFPYIIVILTVLVILALIFPFRGIGLFQRGILIRLEGKIFNQIIAKDYKNSLLMAIFFSVLFVGFIVGSFTAPWLQQHFKNVHHTEIIIFGLLALPTAWFCSYQLWRIAQKERGR